MSKILKIEYRDKRIKTIKELFDDQKIVNITAEDFLNFENPETNRRNRDEFYLSYTKQQKKELNINSPLDIKESTNIYPPAFLYVQLEKVQIDLIKNDSKFVNEEPTESFIGDEIKKIIESNGYYKQEFTKTQPKCTVWIWAKSLEEDNEINSETVYGRIFNLSPFVQNLNIGVTDNGGNFSIRLPFIPGESKYYTKENDPWSQNFLDIDYSEIFINKDEITVDTTLYKFGKRRLSFFNLMAQFNDLVFIKFDGTKTESDDLYISPKNLPNQYFDLIGLIDSVSEDIKPEDTTINMSGRDLMKLLIDDGTFFFPSSYVNKDFESNILINSRGQSDSANTFNTLLETGGNSEGRIITDGIIESFWQAGSRTIPSALEILIKTLSNIEIVPSSLFEFYGDKRSKFNINKKVNNG